MANSPKKATVTAVKGHLVNKSSALAATGSCKLEAQFLTAQNMASHYKRVINAKSSIDTRPPISIIKSQKVRDRAKREMLSLSKSIDRAKSADSLRNSISITTTDTDLIKTTPRAVKSARSGPKEEEIKPRQLPDRDKLNQSMSNLMSQFTSHSKSNQRIQTYKPPTPNFDSNPDKGSATTRSYQSRTSLEDKTRTALSTLLLNSQQDPNQPKMIHPALKAMSRLVGNRNYDVLDNHADKFKNPAKEFVPRIKNTNSESNLSKNSSCYQPPRRRRRKPFDQTTNATESKVSLRETSRENIHNNIQDYDNDDLDREEIPIFKAKPKLNSSRVVYHDDDEDDDNKKNEFLTSFNKSKHESELRQTIEKEDQLKYLQFVKEVTNDILARGISSNRVINNCFENHIRKNRDKLDETKMRELLKTLRKDIGIQDDVEQDNNQNIDANESYHQTINKALNMDKKHQNKDNTNNDEAQASDYLTLKKFGWSNTNTKHELHETQKSNKPDEFIINNIESRSRNSSRRNSVKSQENINRSFKNLQVTSHQNSTESNLNQINDNKENSKPVSHVLVRKQSTGSRKSSNSSTGSPVSRNSILKKTANQSQLEKQKSEKTESNESDDDDDDVFASKYEPINNKSPIKRTQIVKSENNSEDIQFDDDYGPAEETDNDDDNDDDFNNSPNKKTIKNRKKSSESNGSLNISENASLNTSLANKGPTPQPRKTNNSTTINNSTNKKQDNSDDDDDDDEF